MDCSICTKSHKNETPAANSNSEMVDLNLLASITTASEYKKIAIAKKLSQIMILITNSSNNGEFFLTVSSLHPDIKRVLEAKGFTVREDAKCIYW